MAVSFLTNKDKADIEGKLGTKANIADVAELIAKAVKVEKGSYVGDGNKGENFKSKYPFNTPPNMVIILAKEITTTRNSGIWVEGASWLGVNSFSNSSSGSPGSINCSMTNSTLSWWTDKSADEQLNRDQAEYIIMGFYWGDKI